MAFRRNPEWEPGFRKSAQFNKAMTVEARKLGRFIKIAAEPSRNTGYFIRRIVPIGSRVHLHDNFWHLVEYGSVNNPPYAPARRGVVMAGLRFVDDGADDLTA
jgi:hypothetical protein